MAVIVERVCELDRSQDRITKVHRERDARRDGGVVDGQRIEGQLGD
jgi:hypothetical protein